MVNKRSTDLASYANLQGEFKRRFSLHNPGKSGFGDHGEIETLFLSRRETRDFPFFGREEENWPVPGQASSALEASTVLTKRLNLAAHMSTVHINSRRINRKRRRRNAQPCSIARIY